MSTGLAWYNEDRVRAKAGSVREAVYRLLSDEAFETAITYGPNGAPQVKLRFEMSVAAFEEILGAYRD